MPLPWIGLVWGTAMFQGRNRPSLSAVYRAHFLLSPLSMYAIRVPTEARRESTRELLMKTQVTALASVTNEDDAVGCRARFPIDPLSWTVSVLSFCFFGYAGL